MINGWIRVHLLYRAVIAYHHLCPCQFHGLGSHWQAPWRTGAWWHIERRRCSLTLSNPPPPPSSGWLWWSVTNWRTSGSVTLSPWWDLLSLYLPLLSLTAVTVVTLLWFTGMVDTPVAEWRLCLIHRVPVRGSLLPRVRYLDSVRLWGFEQGSQTRCPEHQPSYRGESCLHFDPVLNGSCLHLDPVLNGSFLHFVPVLNGSCLHFVLVLNDGDSLPLLSRCMLDIRRKWVRYST